MVMPYQLPLKWESSRPQQRAALPECKKVTVVTKLMQELYLSTIKFSSFCIAVEVGESCAENDIEHQYAYFIICAYFRNQTMMVSD